ncbi:hypothetical protein JOD43_002308 [Pullulanibacillus pueri]|nr:hypothetical protein [Pullulanibacillus pueri]
MKVKCFNTEWVIIFVSAPTLAHFVIHYKVKNESNGVG